MTEAANVASIVGSDGRPAAPFLRRTVVVVPALNEAACVADTVRSWLALGAARVRVVDNASSDGTGVAARNAGAEVLRESRRGYGAAAWRGLQGWPSECAWVLFSAADGSDQLNAAETAAWQRAIDLGADAVFGDRTASAAGRAQLAHAQRLGNELCCAMIERGWGRRFHDLGSLRVVRNAALQRMRLRDRGFGWNVEMQVRAVELGLRVVELPVGYFPRRAGKSKISGSVLGTLRAGRGILQTLVQLHRLERSRRVRLAERHAVQPG